MPETATGRAYPIRPRPDGDARFTVGLVADVGGALARHGYPEVHGEDFTALQASLYGFVYGQDAA